MPRSAGLLRHSGDLVKPEDILEEGHAASGSLVALHKVSNAATKSTPVKGPATVLFLQSFLIVVVINITACFLHARILQCASPLPPEATGCSDPSRSTPETFTELVTVAQGTDLLSL
jgi:hypothetical protein